MPQLSRSPRVRRDVGAATLEMVGAFGLAAVLVISMIAGATNYRFDGIVQTAICKVKTAAGFGSCSVPETEPPTVDPEFDPKPKKCKIGEHSEQYSSVIKIAFFTFGENAGFIETTYSDGTVTYTATDGAEVGLTAGAPGAKLDIGKLERGVDVDFGGGLKFSYGSTWTFKDADEAKAMREQLDDYLVEQETLKHDTSGGYALWLWIHGATEPPKPPNLQVSTIEVSGDVTGSIGLSLPFDPDKKADESGVPNLNLAEAGFKFGGSHKWTQIHDTTNGSTTYTTGGELFGDVHGTIGPVSGELMGVLGNSMSITRDKDDQITKITLTTTREGKATGTLNGGQPNLGGNPSQSGSDGSVTVSTTSLDVSTPEQRALVNAWLAAQAEGGAVSPETLYPDRLVPGDAFQNLMYTNGTVSNVEYDKVTDKTGFAAEVKLGVAFGIDLSLETSDISATDATYLGVPGDDGHRPPVDFPECVA